jgi:4-amino-4-deoxy-L-arabinose transferase-like glycosyltransferase
MVKKKQPQKVHRKRPVDPVPLLGTSQYLAVSDWIFLLWCTGLLWCVHALWLTLDSRPPIWDMAMHQSFALNYLPGTDLPEYVSAYYTRSGIYPPFVHLMIAFLYLLFHPSPHIAAYANLPATLLLMWAVMRMGSETAGKVAARWACLLTTLVPYLFWMSRETILDYWLTAWVAAGIVTLRHTEGFRRRRQSILLGCILAAGLLTKWLFAAFLIPPIVFLLLRERTWKSRPQLLNGSLSLAACLLISGLWYIPNLSKLVRYFGENTQVGALEGEPPVFTFQSLIYYLRLLEGYQLFAGLFLLLIISLWASWRKSIIREPGFLACFLAGSWAILTLLRTKDPRFTMPLLPFLMIFPAAWIQSWSRRWWSYSLQAALTAGLFLQAYAVNFGLSWLPQEIVIAEGYQGSLRWDWNLFQQHYFHLLGPPLKQDWKHSDILRRANLDSSQNRERMSVALVPDLPRFNALTFQLYSRLLKIPSRFTRLVLTDQGIYPLEAVDYVVTVDNDQGMSWTTKNSLALNTILERSPDVFIPLERFPLPEGNLARLYRVNLSAATMRNSRP